MPSDVATIGDGCANPFLGGTLHMKSAVKIGAAIGGTAVFVAMVVYGCMLFKGLLGQDAPLDFEIGFSVLLEALVLACIGAGLGVLWDK